jgi:hypothetical protein
MVEATADHLGEMNRNRIATLLAMTAVSAAALPVPLAGAKSGGADPVGFVQKVNGICGDAVSSIDNLPAGQDGSVTTKSLRSWARISIRTENRMRAVKAPAYAAKRYGKMIATLKQNRQLGNTIVPQARAGHTKAVENALYTIVKNTQKFNDIAVDLNIGNCAELTFPGYSDTVG